MALGPIEICPIKCYLFIGMHTNIGKAKVRVWVIDSKKMGIQDIKNPGI